MSGRRQHFLPRFLLRGFKSRENSRQFYTQVYRRGVAPYEANIANVGVETDFYSGSGSANTDQVITDVEGDFARVLDEARRRHVPDELLDLPIAEMLTHLIIRTRRARLALQQVGERMCTALTNSIGVPERREHIIRSYIRDNPDKIKKIMQEQLNELGLHENSHPVLKTLMENPQSLADLLPSGADDQLQGLLQQALGKLSASMPYIAIAAHRRALDEAVTPEPRVQQLKGYKFRVVDYQKDNLILGDSGVIGLANEEPQSLIAWRENIDCVCLPITPNRAILGITHAMQVVPTANQINLASACLSKEFFVSAVNNPYVTKLAEHIETCPGAMIESEWQAIETDVFR